ncbi:porin [Hoeflea sp. YIM 152468]|uniref:porin n=1 Tax=Hoeflea sp. YIM 152468 TaxID=3031759 RepID=UPI0023DBD962|nr:porin [Hoeflea sp. YIM 152468]MDF1607722.1 porin [Hoeflea sp. YIM 152468]
MNIKSLLLGSAAALVAVSGARAADAIVAAEPEPVEYVRVCDAFGTGFFYIPGTETCLRIHGYVRYDIGGGDLFERTSATGDGTYNKRARFSFRTSTASETELGTLRTYTELRFQSDTNGTVGGYTNDNEFSVNFAWIQLGGLRVGKDESMFTTFTGYAGSVINDGNFGPFDTNLISYTYNGGAFRAALSLEQGSSDVLVGGLRGGWGIDDYMPHVVVGAGYNAGMVDLSGVFAYDTRDDIVGTIPADVGGWAAKVRADVTINEQASVFAMAMYGEGSSAYATWVPYGVDKAWSIIGGASYQASEKVKLNTQVQWIENKVAGLDDYWSVVANMNYTLVPGLVLTPEVEYRDRGTAVGGQFGAMLRVQRSF